MKPSVLAVIPARAQSKRIPGKNKKFFLGKPLITWSIEAALKSSCITDIVVTTDDSEILNYKSLYPRIRFEKRPDSLAQDSTPGVDPVLHLMQQMETSYDYVLLLQPTSPLRTHSHIDAAFDKLNVTRNKQIVSVKKMYDSLNHVVYLADEKVKMLKDVVKDLPTSDQFKVLNGAIYISDWNTLLSEKTFIGSDVGFYEMDETVSVDIDVTDDWIRAERFAKMKEF